MPLIDQGRDPSIKDHQEGKNNGSDKKQLFHKVLGGCQTMDESTAKLGERPKYPRFFVT